MRLPVFVYDTADAFFHGGTSEIKQQTNRLTGQPEVSQNLLKMRVIEPLHRFDLDDDSLFYKDVDAKSCRMKNAIEFDIDRLLPVNFQPPSGQFARKHDLVDAFEKSGSEFAMNVNGGVDDLAGDCIDLPTTISASPRLRVNLNSP